MRELNFMTMEELERRNYANGHTEMAQLMAKLNDETVNQTEHADQLAELDEEIMALNDKIMALEDEVVVLKNKLGEYE